MAAIELSLTPLYSDANLVYYWRLEADSVASVGSNSGTDTAITYSAGNGKFNNGAGFASATSSKIAFPTLATGTEGSILFWFKTSTATGQTLFQQSKSSVDTRLSIAMSNIANAGEITFSFNVTGTSYIVARTDIHTYDDGNFHHLAVTVDSDGNKIYVDGSLADVTYLAGDASTQKWFDDLVDANVMDLGIARYSNLSISKYNGAIDDVAIFSRALTADEISYLYTGNWPLTVKSVNGLAIASIKSVNGLAIASVKKINGLF